VSASRPLASLFHCGWTSHGRQRCSPRRFTLGKLEEFRASTDSALTERQREVVAEALARGYYDWPREITNEELATELEISRATLHEHLRKAEQTVLSSVMANSHRRTGRRQFERIGIDHE